MYYDGQYALVFYFVRTLLASEFGVVLEQTKFTMRDYFWLRGEHFKNVMKEKAIHNGWSLRFFITSFCTFEKILK